MTIVHSINDSHSVLFFCGVLIALIEVLYFLNFFPTFIDDSGSWSVLYVLWCILSWFWASIIQRIKPYFHAFLYKLSFGDYRGSPRSSPWQMNLGPPGPDVKSYSARYVLLYGPMCSVFNTHIQHIPNSHFHYFIILKIALSCHIGLDWKRLFAGIT